MKVEKINALVKTSDRKYTPQQLARFDKTRRMVNETHPDVSEFMRRLQAAARRIK